MLKEMEDGENNIQTFFRLAEQLILLTKSYTNDQPGNLQWTKLRCYGQTGDAVKVHPPEINIGVWRMNFDFFH